MEAEEFFQLVRDNNIEALKKIPPDTNIHMKAEGTTAMHVAVMANADDALRLLISFGAAVDLKDDEGRTPLYLAVEGKNVEMVYFLCLVDADPSVKAKDGSAPITIAPPSGLIRKMLVDEQARLDEETRFAKSVRGFLAGTRTEILSPVLKNLGIKTLADFKALDIAEITDKSEVTLDMIAVLKKELEEVLGIDDGKASPSPRLPPSPPYREAGRRRRGDSVHPRRRARDPPRDVVRGVSFSHSGRSFFPRFSRQPRRDGSVVRGREAFRA